jgi:hypothetical protein
VVCLLIILVPALFTTASPSRVDFHFDANVWARVEIYLDPDRRVLLTDFDLPRAWGLDTDTQYFIRIVSTGCIPWEGEIIPTTATGRLYVEMQPDPRWTVLFTGPDARRIDVRAGYGGFVLYGRRFGWAIYRPALDRMEGFAASPYALQQPISDTRLAALQVARQPTGLYDTVYASPDGTTVVYPRQGAQGLTYWIAVLPGSFAEDTGVRAVSDCEHECWPASQAFWLDNRTLFLQSAYRDARVVLIEVQGRAVSVTDWRDVSAWRRALTFWPEAMSVERVLAVSPAGRSILAYTGGWHYLLWERSPLRGDRLRTLGRYAYPVAAWPSDLKLRLTSVEGVFEYDLPYEDPRQLIGPDELVNTGSSINAMTADGSAIIAYRFGHRETGAGEALLVRRLPVEIISWKSRHSKPVSLSPTLTF